MIHTSRLYLCIWGDGHVDYDRPAIIERHPLSWFTEDLGYAPTDLAHIKNLELGRSINFDEITTEHSVVRVL